MKTNRKSWFLEQLAKYPRIAVVGPPKAGKTTLCRLVKDRPVIAGDNYKRLGWSEASEAIAKAGNDKEGPLVVEGTAVPRALRKGLKVDAVLFLMEPTQELSPGQKSMQKSIMTIMASIYAANKNLPMLQAPPPMPDARWSDDGTYDVPATHLGEAE